MVSAIFMIDKTKNTIMKVLLSSMIVLVIGITTNAQYYFPPTTGNQWDTVSPASLGWCVSELDTLSNYLDSRHSKSFIILHKGKIAYERYYNGHGQDTSWYWASAGKSLTAFLIGMAQDQNLLDINDKTSDYLGRGWTVAPPAKEDLITIKQQMLMTTGLDFNVPNQNCLEDTCLKYLHDAGSHWYYHNAPYRLLQDVVASAAGKNYNLYTFQSLANSTGITGLWLNYIFFSKARNMARFGLLNLNKGVWNGTRILNDTAYFSAMISPSQSHNPAYGYLWWLNGSSFYKQPGFDITFPGQIIPTAPADLYMAAGANDQRIYVVPSLDLVVVRQGNEAYTQQAALSQFDPELWGLLMNVVCTPISLEERNNGGIEIFPNPVWDFIHLSNPISGNVRILESTGKEVIQLTLEKCEEINVSTLPKGFYLIYLDGNYGSFIKL